MNIHEIMRKAGHGNNEQLIRFCRRSACRFLNKNAKK